MSFCCTPSVHRPQPLHHGSDIPTRRCVTNSKTLITTVTAREDRLQWQRRETPLNDGTDMGSTFIFPATKFNQPNSTDLSPPPRSPFSADSLTSRPAGGRRDTATSRLSPISQPESVIDVSLGVGVISILYAIITLSVGFSSGSVLADVGGNKGMVDNGRINVVVVIGIVVGTNG